MEGYCLVPFDPPCSSLALAEALHRNQGHVLTGWLPPFLLLLETRAGKSARHTHSPGRNRLPLKRQIGDTSKGWAATGYLAEAPTGLQQTPTLSRAFSQFTSAPHGPSVN